MIEFKCHQTAYSTHVTLNDGAVVTISRAVGSPKARALMRLCRDVLNGDMLAAQHELDLLGGDDDE